MNQPDPMSAHEPKTSLRQAVAATFASDGPLAGAGEKYAPREVQTQMSCAVAEVIDAQDALVVEAGTGVGKTFAYLVPVLLSGRRALISTATKTLQDQLFFRDLPRLRASLSLPTTVALLKGRGSYLCRHRMVQARDSATLPDRFAVRALARIEEWAQGTVSGDLSELEGLDERSEVIPLVTSSRDNCLGNECPEVHGCHVMKARREALAADVVVVNHHLFFADLALRDSGVAELLPAAEIAVFDEAHQMVEAGIQFLGQTFGTSQLQDFARDLQAAGVQHARGQAPWLELSAAVERAGRDLRLAVARPGEEIRALIKRRWDELGEAQTLMEGLESARTALRAAMGGLELVVGAEPDFARLHSRAQELMAQAAMFLSPVAHERVRWIDVTPYQARLVESPLDIRSLMQTQRGEGARAWIFTSATLGDDPGLSWFCESAGLEDARKLRLGSPFDYAERARLYIPPRFPSPQDERHPVMVGRSAGHCAHALGGRTFVLTTTLRAMKQVAQALQSELVALGSDIQVLVQGTQAKRTLMERFLRGRAVLVGSHSFWEGVDVPGDALQCVMIDKLPFPPPNDPLVEARVRQLKSQGRDAFSDYFVAEAAIALKQGAGRLIRTNHDQGLLVVCDTRLLTARYGTRLQQALPPMTTLDSGEEALRWLSGLQSAGRLPLPSRAV